MTIFPQRYRYFLLHGGVISAAICFGLVIGANAFTSFAASRPDFTGAVPAAAASACVWTGDLVADAASRSFPVPDQSGSALAFGFVTFDWDPGAGIPGFGPLSTPSRLFAGRIE